jgi:hypothetical protein
MPVTLALCGSFEPVCPKRCVCSCFGKKKKKKARAAGEGGAVGVFSAENVQITGLVAHSDAHDVDVLLFDRETRVIAASGPSLARWGTQDAVGQLLFEVMDPAFERMYRQTCMRALDGKHTSFISMWGSAATLVVGYPVFGPRHSGEVVGGLVVGQPCAGLEFNLASTSQDSPARSQTPPPQQTPRPDPRGESSQATQ